MATKALARLVSLTSDPDATSVMTNAGVVATAETFVKRPDSSDRNVALAGSLLTMLCLFLGALRLQTMPLKPFPILVRCLLNMW